MIGREARAADARRRGPAARRGRRLRRRRLERDRDVRRLPRRRRRAARRRRGGRRGEPRHGPRRACSTARARRCSPTRTARSPTRTRSRPGSTTRASAPSTRACATPAAPTYVPRDRRRGARRVPPARRDRGDHPRARAGARARAGRSTSTRSWSLVCLSGRGDKDLAEALRSATRMSKTLVIYLWPGRRRPSSPRAAVAGGADIDRDRLPVLRPARRRPGDPARRASARSPRGCAPRRASSAWPRRASASVDVPLVPMTYASLLEAYGWERFAADARAAGADEPDRRRPPRRAQRPELRAGPARRADLDRRADRARRRRRPTAGSTSSRHRHDRARAPSCRPRSRPRRAGARRSPTCRSTPASASRRPSRPPPRPSSPTASSSARGGRGRGGRPGGARRRTSRRCGPRSTLRPVDANALPAPRAAGATLREEEALRLGDAVPQDPAEVRLQGPGPTRTSIFPRFAPSSIPMNASGARSMPSTIVSR